MSIRFCRMREASMQRVFRRSQTSGTGERRQQLHIVQQRRLDPPPCPRPEAAFAATISAGGRVAVRAIQIRLGPGYRSCRLPMIFSHASTMRNRRFNFIAERMSGGIQSLIVRNCLGTFEQQHASGDQAIRLGDACPGLAELLIGGSAGAAFREPRLGDVMSRVLQIARRLTHALTRLARCIRPGRPRPRHLAAPIRAALQCWSWR